MRAACWLPTLVFATSIFGYFWVSKAFQSEERAGWLAGDGRALLVAGILFCAFTASYIEIFDFAFRLPYPAIADIGIGLGLVGLAVAAAYAAFTLIRRRAVRLGIS